AYDPKAQLFIDTKNEASDRHVPIASALRKALLEYRVAFGAFDPDALMVGENGQPFDDRAARYRARDTWVEAELQPILLHEARHTAASLMIAAGVNVKALSEFMGHQSVTTTLDLYGHLLPGSLSEAATLLDTFLERTGTASGTRE